MSAGRKNFEQLLLDLLCRQPPADLMEIRDKLGARSDFDSGLAKEYLFLLKEYGTLFVKRQFDVALAWTRIEHGISSQSRVVALGRQTDKHSTRLISLLRKAATVAATIGFVVFLTKIFFPNPYVTITATDEMVHFLPEGTKVNLKPGAEIKYLRGKRFMIGAEREVLVKGDLEFDVTADPQNPFYTVSNLTRVQVLGTIFKYKAEGSISSAENIEGIVDFQVLSDTSHAVLNPGDKVFYDGAVMRVEKYEPPIPPPLPVIPSHTLSALDLIEILGLRYPIRLEFPPYLSNVTGVISCNLNKPLEELLLELSENEEVDIKYYPLGRGRFVLEQLQGSATPSKITYTFDDYKEEFNE